MSVILTSAVSGTKLLGKGGGAARVRLQMSWVLEVMCPTPMSLFFPSAAVVRASAIVILNSVKSLTSHPS